MPGFDSIGGKILAPLLRLGKALEKLEATPHEPEDVGHKNQAANKFARPSKRHREANAIVEKRPAFAFDEAVIVLEGAEAAGNHAVLKEVRRIPCLGHD